MGIPILGEIEKLINEHGSAKILSERIGLAKDQYTALEKELSASRARESVFETENLRLKLDNVQLNGQIKMLEERIHNDSLLTLKYGAYWDKDGNPYCPKCKTPTSHVDWVIHVSQHFHGLKCSCTDHPILLMNNGEPIHATEAMKIMAKTDNQKVMRSGGVNTGGLTPSQRLCIDEKRYSTERTKGE